MPSHGHVVDGRHEALDVNERISKRKQKKGENSPARLRPPIMFALLSFAEMLESNGEDVRTWLFNGTSGRDYCILF